MSLARCWNNRQGSHKGAKEALPPLLIIMPLMGATGAAIAPIESTPLAFC